MTIQAFEMDEKEDSQTSSRSRHISTSLLLFACFYGGVWSTLLVDLIEPIGSGGFVLHVVSMWSNLAILALVLSLTALSLRRKERFVLHVVAAACVLIGIARLSNQ